MKRKNVVPGTICVVKEWDVIQLKGVDYRGMPSSRYFAESDTVLSKAWWVKLYCRKLKVIGCSKLGSRVYVEPVDGQPAADGHNKIYIDRRVLKLYQE